MLTGLAENIEETLHRTVDDYADEIRVAAFVLLALGKEAWLADSRSNAVHGDVGPARLYKPGVRRVRPGATHAARRCTEWNIRFRRVEAAEMVSLLRIGLPQWDGN